ncbi:MAG: hypothetical protein EBX23_02795 [Proteobacteria bacterium]|nr:hypothetical protein [Pseudomonadota bacterium]
MNNKIIATIFLFTSVGIFAGHHGDGHKSMGNSEEWEIETYTSAAPDFIGNFATVVGASGEVIREGTNGWTCLPFIPMPKMGFKTANEAAPACADANAVAWANAYIAQAKPEIENDGWIWMKHGDTGVDNFRPYSEGDKANTKAEDWIYSGSHLMLMPKDPSSLDGVSTDFTTGAPYVMMKGTPFVHLMIPLDGYYDYQPESAPK